MMKQSIPLEQKNKTGFIPTDETLMIPGPTPVPPQVLMEMSKPMINHRGSTFTSLYAELQPMLKSLFQTKEEVLILTASGTGGMEAAVVNTLSPGDLVLACPVGVFGERFTEIAKRYGAKVEVLETPMGEALAPNRLEARLKEDPAHKIKAILITHNETSTGVENDLKEIVTARDAAGHPALILVDAVSSMGAVELYMDKWGIDVVVTASQKALMTPPGLAFVAMGSKGWEAQKNAAMPRFYLDLKMALDFGQKGQTPFTPALSVMFALKEALRLVETQGLTARIAHHKAMSEAVRRAVQEMGLSLFAKNGFSSTVTAICNPPGIDGKIMRDCLRKDYNVVVAGGQGKLADKIFRIGHVGYVGKKEALYTLTALEQILRKMGCQVNENWQNSF